MTDIKPIAAPVVWGEAHPERIRHWQRRPTGCWTPREPVTVAGTTYPRADYLHRWDLVEDAEVLRPLTDDETSMAERLRTIDNESLTCWRPCTLAQLGLDPAFDVAPVAETVRPRADTPLPHREDDDGGHVLAGPSHWWEAAG